MVPVAVRAGHSRFGFFDRARVARVQTLTIEAATEASGQALFHALSRFQPHWTKDGQGRYFVTVMLGSDQRVLAVLEAIQQHLTERAEGDRESSFRLALDGRQYTLHDD
jgi:hypothetical protein